MKKGKIINGKLVYATHFEGSISNPAPGDLELLGFKDVVDVDEFTLTEDETTIYNGIKQNLPTLEERKGELLNELLEVSKELNSLRILCELDHSGEQGLIDAINMSKVAKNKAKADIDALQTIEAAMAFQIRQNDVENLKSLYKNYLW